MEKRNVNQMCPDIVCLTDLGGIIQGTIDSTNKDGQESLMVDGDGGLASPHSSKVFPSSPHVLHLSN